MKKQQAIIEIARHQVDPEAHSVKLKTKWFLWGWFGFITQYETICFDEWSFNDIMIKHKKNFDVIEIKGTYNEIHQS